MKRDTLIALRKSIQKWDRIANGTCEDNGSGNCELCKRFNAEFCKRDDEECPVVLKVGKKGCRKTPFTKWQGHQDSAHNEIDFPYRIKLNCKRCVVLAKKEFNFLKSLLPVIRKKVVVTVIQPKEPFDLIIRFEKEV